MSETYTGSGQALIISSKCNKLVPFTSSYKWTYGGDGSDVTLAKLEYENSFIGSRTLSAVYGDNELSSDGLLNFSAFYYDDGRFRFVYVRITGVYKKCNYSSHELDILTSSSSAASVKVNKKSGSSEEFHKLLDEKPNLKKKYLEIKAKLGK